MKLRYASHALSSAFALALVSGVVASAGVVRHPVVRGMSTGARNTARHGFKCPPSYGDCVSVTAGSPLIAEYCVSTSGNCSSGLTGPVDWIADLTILRDTAKAKKLRASWSPDPGNPSIFTLSTTAKTAKRTKVIASLRLSVCYTSGSCYDLGFVGITN